MKKRAWLIIVTAFALVFALIPNFNGKVTAQTEQIYTKNYQDGQIGDLKNIVGKMDASIESSQLKMKRDSAGGNEALIADQGSPDLANGEAQAIFTLKNGSDRFGIAFRVKDAAHWAFAGYDSGGKWAIVTPDGYKSGISGPILEENQKYVFKVSYSGTKIEMSLGNDTFFSGDVGAELPKFPKEAGKTGYRTWYDDKEMYISQLQAGEIGSIPPVESKFENYDPVEVYTKVKTAPALPKMVTAHYSDGKAEQKEVKWDEIPAASYAQAGDFAVKGTVAGIEEQPEATVHVLDDTSPEPGDVEKIASKQLEVSLDKAFPRIISYQLKDSGQWLNGQPEAIDKLRINNQDMTPSKVDFKKKGQTASYTLHFEQEKLIVRTDIAVQNGQVKLTIPEIKENGGTKVSTIAFPNQKLLSVYSTEAGAAFAGAKMFTATTASTGKTGDTFVDLTGSPAVDKTPQGYMYGILNNDQIAASLWTNSVYDKPDNASKNNNGRVLKQTTRTDRGYNTGIWSGEWTVRPDGATEMEKDKPELKITLTGDRNQDQQVDWQDGAIAFRDIMNNPAGSDQIPNLVVQRIPMNFASQATNPFLVTLDETKRIALSTDGLGQNVLLKGYQNEGHDSGHPDYGLVGERQGGAKEMQQLVDRGHQLNAAFGVHVNATESYPEAKAFSEELVDPSALGWDWLDSSYRIKTRHDAISNNRLQRFEDLKKVAPNLDFVYVDVWYGDGWESKRLAEEIKQQGYNVYTEFPSAMESDAVWTHWSADKNYGGSDTKGINSTITRFIRNHQKDNWVITDNPLLGGTELIGAEGWAGRVAYDQMIRNTFEVNLPTKYLQHHTIQKWQTDLNGNGVIELSDQVVTRNDNSAKERVITDRGVTVLQGNSYLLPWQTDGSNKLYHYNKDGGSTTWQLLDEWKNHHKLKLYQLTDQGNKFIGNLPVKNGKVTIQAEKETAYILVADNYPINEVAKKAGSFGEYTAIKDPGFNAADTLHKNWKSKGNGSKVIRNENGQYELQLSGSQASSVSQKIKGLPEGKYIASVNAEVTGKGQTGGIKLSAHKKSIYENKASESFAENFMSADSKHTGEQKSYMQRMQVSFEVKKGKPITLELYKDAGNGTIHFDDVRITKDERTVNPAGIMFYEDFEHVSQGWYPFVKGNAGGVTDPRTHLSELHAPYTQKGWNGNTIDDVISGNWSLKLHKENGGRVMQTIPETIRFEPNKRYKISFKYQANVDNGYSLVIGTGTKQQKKINLPKATDTQTYTFEIKGAPSGLSWFGIEQNNAGQGDMVIDELQVVEK
ncbi:endo-alpha-N-acetylgalactosaminidase family protein [Listeria ilorinensis]|uniref:endo-alpha-N-acetylgalactosaminidase family protein n=1 Tax=Listeria ilorinensis TaxID=2867439 RepID=UPI001EF4BDBB|nr:endo-alpha-N-acetylgalactosaminidase family protein [Listeria ilorinensis]